MDWRKEVESIVGGDGFIGGELDSDEAKAPVPLDERTGALWQHARMLKNDGFIVDTKGYAACFRINQKLQGPSVDFDSLVNGMHACPSELATSTNLGCVDFYPASCGKKNWCVCPGRNTFLCFVVLF